MVPIFFHVTVLGLSCTSEKLVLDFEFLSARALAENFSSFAASKFSKTLGSIQMFYEFDENGIHCNF